MKQPCSVSGCPTLVPVPQRHCGPHAREAESYRLDPGLLDPDWLSELEEVSPQLPFHLIDVARTEPMTLPEVVRNIRADPVREARTWSAAWQIAHRHERWDEGRARCDACRHSVVGTVEVPMGGPDLSARICESCYELANESAYRANPWWCPRCRARPTGSACTCPDAPEPPEVSWGARLGEEPASMAAGVLLALAERNVEPRGLRIRHPKHPNGVPLAVHFLLDDLTGARLAFVLAQLARRHVAEGALGPGWHRRGDGKDVPLKDDHAKEEDPATRLLARLHASDTLASILRHAGPGQLRAIERLADGEPLTNAERQALHRLRKNLPTPP